MFNLFAKKPKEKMKQSPIDAIKAIEDLSLKIDHMEEKIRFIDTKMKGLNNDAKIRLKNGDKNGARQALAKKKKYDEQIKQYDGAILLMEEQKLMLEGAETMRNIIDSIKKANTILSDSQKVISADEIVNIKEELEVCILLSSGIQIQSERNFGYIHRVYRTRKYRC
jgi:phage shock protein A